MVPEAWSSASSAEGEALDMSYIEHWVSAMQLTPQWPAVRALAGRSTASFRNTPGLPVARTAS
jgi:hypothetical protein